MPLTLPHSPLLLSPIIFCLEAVGIYQPTEAFKSLNNGLASLHEVLLH